MCCWPLPSILFTRACLNIGDVSSGEEFWAAGKQFFRRNPGGFQGKIVPSSVQKDRRLGMLTFFKQALENIDVFAAQRLVHAPDGAELAAHGAAVLILRRPAVSDALCRLRIYGALPLLFPVKGASGVRHGVVQVPCVGHLLGDIRGMGGNPGGDNALLDVLHIGGAKCSAGVT